MQRPAVMIGVVAVVLAVAGAGVWTMVTPSDPDGAPAQTPQGPPPPPGVLDEPFELFDGQQARLADWRGTPMVVNFWASWCPPCVAEMRDALEPMHRELGDDVVFVGLNLQDARADADAMVDQTGVSYTLGLDPDGELFAAFGGFGMPTTLFIDDSQSVVENHTGAFTRDQLRDLIEANLGV